MRPKIGVSRGIARRGEAGAPWRRLYARQARALLAIAQAGALQLSLPPSPSPRQGPDPFASPEPRFRWRALRAGASGLALALAFYVLATSLLVACYRFVDPPATVLMAWRKYGFGWKPTAPRPLPIKKVPAYIRRMLVSVEDGKFYEHHGLDFEAFRNARAINERIGKPLYGGSTLTMQVARTLFLVPVKSYLRKALEIVVALELELFLPKDRILELYFGYAEWGKGIYGIEGAARRYFGASVQSLSRDQAARLIALLSSPIKYSPSTLSRNGILRERYAYLHRRYVEARPAASISSSPNALSSLDSATSAPPASALAAEASAAEAPPPSPEPGTDAADEGEAAPGGSGAPAAGERGAGADAEGTVSAPSVGEAAPATGP